MKSEITLFEFYNSKQSPASYHNIFGTIDDKGNFVVSFNFSFWTTTDKPQHIPKDALVGQIFSHGDMRVKPCSPMGLLIRSQCAR